jgi:hypothetical protein
LEVFTVAPSATTYKPAAGASEAITADLLAAIYKRSVGAAQAFVADPQSTIYKQKRRETNFSY